MQYKKVKNCGPVPYPDKSGRFLIDEIVTGDEWQPFLELGYVEAVEIEANVGNHFPDVIPSVIDENQDKIINNNIFLAENDIIIDNAKIAERRGVEGMGDPEARRLDGQRTGSEGASDQGAPRRRRKRI